MKCAFGILSNKWRIFQRPLNAIPGFAVDFVKARVILHNFVRERDNYNFNDAMRVTGLEDVPNGLSVCGELTEDNVRNQVAYYFLTDAGVVAWKM